MPEPVSTAFLIVGYAAYTLPRFSTAVSSEASIITENAGVIAGKEEEAQSLFGPQSHLISEIIELSKEHNESLEDGIESILEGAIENAISLVRYLPRRIPLPEVASEPDGSLSLDWMPSRTRILSISVGETDRLAYAYLNGSSRGRGVAQFDGVGFPAEIESLVKTIFGYGDAPIGIAG